MLPVSKKREIALQALGQRLKESRLARNDTQAVFAERIGVSEKTLRQMENGSPHISIGTWFDAVDVIGSADDFYTLLPAQTRRLFDAQSQRKRARPKKSRP